MNDYNFRLFLSLYFIIFQFNSVCIYMYPQYSYVFNFGVIGKILLYIKKKKKKTNYDIDE